MAKPTITETIEASDPTAVSGSLRLMALSGGGGIGYTYGGSPVSIGQVIRVSFDSSGELKADDGTTALSLNPNTNTSGLNTDAIVTPSDTVWVYEIRYPGTRTATVRFLSVPDGAGPYNVADIFAVEPGDLGAMAGLENLRDTDVGTAADGDVLVYDTPPGLWRATAPTDLAAVTIGTGTADGDRVLVETGGAIVRVPVNTLRGGPGLVTGDSSGTRLRSFDNFDRLTNTANSTDNTVSQGSGLIIRLAAPGTQTNSSAAELVAGSIQVSTGAGTGRCAAHWFHLTQLFSSSFNYRVAFRARLTAVPDGTNSYEAQLGMGNDWTTATRINSYYFRALNGTAQPNWYAVSVDGTTTSATDTTIALDNAYHVFDIRYNAALTTFYYYIDGVQRMTQTRLPTTFTSASPGFGIYKTLGATTRGLHVDWIYVETPITSSIGLEYLA